jgi:hypothetical protein
MWDEHGFKKTKEAYKMGAFMLTVIDKFSLDKSVIYKYTARTIRPNPINKSKEENFQIMK